MKSKTLIKERGKTTKSTALVDKLIPESVSTTDTGRTARDAEKEL